MALNSSFRRSEGDQSTVPESRNASDGRDIEQVFELTGGEGVDYCFEAAGNLRVMEKAYSVTSGKG